MVMTMTLCADRPSAVPNPHSRRRQKESIRTWRGIWLTNEGDGWGSVKDANPRQRRCALGFRVGGTAPAANLAAQCFYTHRLTVAVPGVVTTHQLCPDSVCHSNAVPGEAP